MSNIVELEGVFKTYTRGAEDVRAVDGLDLAIQKGEYLSIVGPSGSGKTTLLNLIGCVDVPTEGKVRLHGIEAEGLSENALSAIRSTTVGFVFQHFFLMPTLTAVENVMLPGRFCRKKIPGLRDRALELLEIVGMTERADHLPAELSGGEMQRVAIARSLINDPDILLADEPTGNLDSDNAAEITGLFKRLNAGGLTVVVVTHNPELAADSASSIHLQDGKIISEVRAPLTSLERDRSELAEPDSVPEYVADQRKREWGSLPAAAISIAACAALVLSAFLSWTVAYSGYRLLTLYTYDTSTYGGNILFRTYTGRSSVLFTGFWPILGALVLLVAALGILLKARWASWLVLGTGSIIGALAISNIVVIYARLQPGTGTTAGAPVMHPGVGLWIYLGASVCAIVLGLWLVLGGRRLPEGADKLERRSSQHGRAELMAAEEHSADTAT